MATQYKQGDILTGKVTGIKPYGAFVALDDETQGLVHISEIKHGFVKDIHDVLHIGDEVKVKVLQIDEEKGKVSLSIRALEKENAPQKQTKARRRQGSIQLDHAGEEGFNTLKAKLKEWIEKSEREDLIKK
ncbi:S1 domain-containing post-transcriptional regulator GSP13 [Siminovitchia sp. FSL H7-0308]|uniref:General stress protein 13 n=1 Tax=Siminovitchia thermophila TaxID=1245522 RepID=A0ABS2R2Z9_9BACI|nr:S1 domain-containing post-transcriptional regulator GSP13 [Siminovitchia thermophila]MBM7714022.1 general stress protein 13 [Siminovitchia thermophila]ONK23896.1 RNA-binding protein S1 [Bacillus sp. VT-16-64]